MRFATSGRRRPDRDAEAVGDPVERQVDVVELVAVEDGAQVPVRYVKLAIAAAAMVVVAVVGSNLLPASGDGGGSGPAVSPSPSSSAAAATSPSPLLLEIDPGRYDIPWPQMRIQLTMPAGWSSANNGTTITRHPPDGPGPTLTLSVHAVTRVVTDVCAAERSFVEVGPTVEDLTTTLANQVGIQRSGPTDVMLGGHPAKRFVLTIPGSCPGPEGRLIWAAGVLQPGFWLLDGGTATIYVVDVNGDRLVITSHNRGSSAEDLAQLDTIIASIAIEPSPSPTPAAVDIEGLPPIGRHSLTVDGVRFSFSVPTSGWERFGGISINKSSQGPQGAEAMIYWSSFPTGVHADACAPLLSPPVGPAAADLAAAVSTVPGTELVTGPSDVTVGGRAAKHVVLTVREDVGCDPGFFYTWQDLEWGALWTDTRPGDTIRVWIVDVDGARLFIAGETHTDAGAYLEQEIQQIVESIRFD